MVLVKIERLSEGKVVFSTIVEWSEEDLTTFLETIEAKAVHLDSRDQVVWESEYPSFRVHVTKGFGE